MTLLNTYRGGPDARGRFGIYGGRFVAETLMPLILELEEAYEAAKSDPAFRAELDAWLADYAAVADMLLFDARPPPGPGMLPGGNGLPFDWRLLHGLAVERPWLLSGGLSAANLGAAVRLCGARAVDVSSGVEDRPGHKDPARIRRFLEVAATLGAPA